MTTLLAQRGNTTTELTTFVLEECANCSVPFMMTREMNNMLRANPGKTFYCPNGHGQHYTGKTPEQKKREELEQKLREVEEQKDRITNRFLQTINERNEAQRQLKRIHKGVCPCCNRSFQDLKKHMATKHPELVVEKKKRGRPRKT
jgi:uncharacterized Zn finger protein (UPF0148 family)